MKKWYLIVGAGLLVLGATILLSPLGATVAVATAGDWAVVGGGSAIMAGFVTDHRMSEEEINEAFERAEVDAEREPRADPSDLAEERAKTPRTDESWERAIDPEDLAEILAAALASNDLGGRKAARAALVDLAQRDPQAALRSLEVGLTSTRYQDRDAAGQALLLLIERLEDPRQAHPLVVRAIRSPHPQLRMQGGVALRAVVRRTSEARKRDPTEAATAGLIAYLPGSPTQARAR